VLALFSSVDAPGPCRVSGVWRCAGCQIRRNRSYRVVAVTDGPRARIAHCGREIHGEEVGDELSERTVEPTEEDPVWDRLSGQLVWYRERSRRAQLAYKSVKLGQLAVGACVPVIAALSAPAAVTAIVSAIVVVAEGAQQLFQWHTNWLDYRSTAEALKREKFLYLAHAGRYADEDRRVVLAQRVEDVIAGQNDGWAKQVRAPSDQRREHGQE
jgi:hypothetical protein